MTAPLKAAESSVKPRDGGASYSLHHRLLRSFWALVWALFASWTPPPLRRWRILLLKLFGAQVHHTANVYGSARIWYPPNLVMKPKSTLGPGVICYCMERIEIGARAIVSQRVHLCGGTHDFEDADFQLMAFPIVISDDAWIAADAFVGPGVFVGEGAVLGARGVATKNLDPWTVYAGNPARPLRTRRRGGLGQ